MYIYNIYVCIYIYDILYIYIYIYIIYNSTVFCGQFATFYFAAEEENVCKRKNRLA